MNMARIDPLQRAAECERLMQVVAEASVHKDALARLRCRWISLGADRPMITRAEFEQKLDEMGEVHDIMLAEIGRLH